MTTPIDASTAKDQFDHLLEEVRRHGEQYAIQEGSETVAVLISPDDFQALSQQQQLKEQAWVELEVLLRKVHTRNAHISPEQAAQDVGEAIREIRLQKRP
jgi:PHD/YefM family antitoxin component YafN of YafNO toxin-antitoxin module